MIATFQSTSKQDDDLSEDFAMAFDSNVSELFQIDCPNLFEVSSGVVNRQENRD